MIEVLKVSSKSNPNSVAGALAGVVRVSGSVEIQVVGAGALNQAIKAVAIARGYMATSGQDLTCRPTFADIRIDGESRTAIRLQVEACEMRPASQMVPTGWSGDHPRTPGQPGVPGQAAGPGHSGVPGQPGTPAPAPGSSADPSAGVAPAAIGPAPTGPASIGPAPLDPSAPSGPAPTGPFAAVTAPAAVAVASSAGPLAPDG